MTKKKRCKTTISLANCQNPNWDCFGFPAVRNSCNKLVAANNAQAISAANTAAQIQQIQQAAANPPATTSAAAQTAAPAPAMPAAPGALPTSPTDSSTDPNAGWATTSPTALSTPATKTALSTPATKNNTMLYIGIAVVAVGVIGGFIYWKSTQPAS